MEFENVLCDDTLHSCGGVSGVSCLLLGLMLLLFFFLLPSYLLES
jgi:hypothetical protein